MNWTHAVRTRLRDLGGAVPPDAVIEELAQHLEQRYDDAVAAGMEAAAARHDALMELRDLGALTRALRGRPRRVQPAPSPPATGGPHMWSDLSADIRYAARLLLRHRGFTTAAVLTIALGIGAVTAMFSVVDAVLLRPLPYPAPTRLVAVWETDRNSGTTHEPASLPDLLDLRRHSRRIDAFGGVIPDELNLTPRDGEPTRLAALYVSSQVLPLLGVRAVLGRVFTGDEHHVGRDDVILISERLWARAFQSDPHAVGRTLRLDDRLRTVVGIVPDTADVGLLQWLLAADYGRGFADRDARTRVDVWVPLPMDPKALPRDTHPVLTLGRLAPGASIEEAQHELTAVMAELERAYPSNRARGARAEPFTQVVLGRVRAGLWVLLAGVCLLLVIACVNVANLLLVRGTARVREVAVRMALGAATRRLTRQFLVENALLAAVGAGLGIVTALVLVKGLVRLAPAEVPRLAMIAVDARVLAISFAVTACVAVACGLVPVLQAWRIDVSRALAADGERAATAGRHSGRLRSALVAGEIALAVILTVAAGLMIRTVVRLQAVDPGFHVTRVYKAEFQLPDSRYPRDFRQWPDFAEMHRFNATLLEQVRRLPGIEAVALAGSHPLDAGFTNSFVVVGREAEARQWPEIAVRRATPGYFAALRVPLVRGRLFQDGDDTAAAPVVLVNEAAAARFFDRRDPIGQQIRFWGTARQIVGVVGNERFHGVAESAPPAVYAPLAQTPSANGAEVLLVRVAQPAEPGIAGALRRVIRGVDPALAVFGEEPLAVTLTESIGQRRFVMVLLAAFAGLALLLAALGVYAMLGYDVAQRRREIGIRMALGARPAAVGRLVIWRGTALAGAGLLTGGLASIGLTRVLRSLLYEVAPGDLTTLVTVSALLGVVAALASYLPARRVVRMDPVRALRDEG
jgi:putative ABC transport system permease protein